MKLRIGSAQNQRDDAGQDQDLDGIEAHGRQRVDFLAHFHRAEFGGVGAARTAGDHDRDDQHAEFAQHQDADHVDDVGVGAEFAEMEDALLRDDGADQEGDQHHDRDRLKADLVELIDQRCHPQRSRPAQHADRAPGNSEPSICRKTADVFRRTDRGAADVIHLGHDGI